jgi:hypothetical protein
MRLKLRRLWKERLLLHLSHRHPSSRLSRFGVW